MKCKLVTTRPNRTAIKLNEEDEIIFPVQMTDPLMQIKSQSQAGAGLDGNGYIHLNNQKQSRTDPAN